MELSKNSLKPDTVTLNKWLRYQNLSSDYTIEAELVKEVRQGIWTGYGTWTGNYICINRWTGDTSVAKAELKNNGDILLSFFDDKMNIRVNKNTFLGKPKKVKNPDQKTLF